MSNHKHELIVLCKNGNGEQWTLINLMENKHTWAAERSDREIEFAVLITPDVRSGHWGKHQHWASLCHSGIKILISCSCSSDFEVRRQDKRKSASCGSNILEQTLQFKGILKMNWSTGNISYTWRWHDINLKKPSFSSPAVALAPAHLSLTPSVQLVHRTFYGGIEGVSLSLRGVLRLNLNLHKSTLWGSLSTLKHLICL